MTLMTFDPDHAELPRARLLHTHRGHILGLRVLGKTYLVLPSVACGDEERADDAERLTRAVYEQTGLFVLVGEGYMGEVDGNRVYAETTIIGGALRPVAGFFHPSEWRNSPDCDRVTRWTREKSHAPLTWEKVSLYPHEVGPGDRYTFPITGTRYERTLDDERVSFQFESYGESAALGRDDAFGEDAGAEPEEEGRGKRRRKVVERDAQLGYVWGQPHRLDARIIVYRLGGDYRGPST